MPQQPCLGRFPHRMFHDVPRDQLPLNTVTPSVKGPHHNGANHPQPLSRSAAQPCREQKAAVNGSDILPTSERLGVLDLCSMGGVVPNVSDALHLLQSLLQHRKASSRGGLEVTFHDMSIHIPLFLIVL